MPSKKPVSRVTALPMLLDTCAALWLMGGHPLSAASREAIFSTKSAGLGIYVSPFSAWEIGTLVAKGRVQLTFAPEIWFETLLALPGMRLAELTPRILLSSTTLPGAPPNDPADRIIAATARACGYCVVTRDQKLLSYAGDGHMRAIEC